MECYDRSIKYGGLQLVKIPYFANCELLHLLVIQNNEQFNQISA